MSGVERNAEQWFKHHREDPAEGGARKSRVAKQKRGTQKLGSRETLKGQRPRG